MSKRKLSIQYEFPVNYSETDQQICQLIHDNITYNFKKQKTVSLFGGDSDYKSLDDYINIKELLCKHKFNTKPNFMLKLIKIDNKMFYNISSELKTNKEFIYNCVKINVDIFPYIDIKFQNNMEIVSYVIQKSPKLLRFASNSIQVVCCQNNENLTQYMSAKVLNAFNYNKKYGKVIANIK